MVIGPSVWTKDSKGIYFTSNEGREFHSLRWMRDITDPNSVVDLTPDILWDVEDLTINADGSVVAFGCNEDGASQIYLLHTATQTRTQLAHVIPLCVVSALLFHPTQVNILAVGINAATTPGDVFSLDISQLEEKGQQALVRWTFSEVGGLPGGIFVSPRLIYFDTFDKDPAAVHKGPDGTRRIPAYVYTPRKPGTAGKVCQILFLSTPFR